MRSRALRRNGIAIAVLTAGLAMFAGGCAPKPGTNEIVIGVFGSLTGNDADFGQSSDPQAGERKRVVQEMIRSRQGRS